MPFQDIAIIARRKCERRPDNRDSPRYVLGMRISESPSSLEQCIEWLESNARPFDHIYDAIIVKGSISELVTWLQTRSRGQYGHDELMAAIQWISYWEVIDWIRQDAQGRDTHAIACTNDFIARIEQVWPDLAEELRERHMDALR